MHELSIVQSMLELAVSQAQRAGASRIYQLRLMVGDRSGVVTEALSFAFEACIPGTIAEGSQLTIERLPALCYCQPCDQVFTPEDWIDQCPHCSTLSRDLRQGRELHLVSMEVI